MFKDIIVGVTPTGIDQCAVRAAVEFAKQFEAKLYVSHVAGMDQGWGSIETLAPSGETEKLRERIVEMYGELVSAVPEAQVSVVAGIPHNELLRLARTKNADLIVMGPHTKEYEEKRSKMWGMAGSTLERVSQKARCPVMIVHRDVALKEPLFENILVATDFSEQSECAVHYGGQMARQYKAKLTVMNVLDPAEGGSVEDGRAKLEKRYGERLYGIDSFHFEACEGTPAMEILRVAQQMGADLIIMAHHSKEMDPEKAFLGSTVTQVALNSTCPTMSVNRHFDLRCGLMYDQTGAAVQVEVDA
ncbi:nucleotide-binding universal stress UspA family protein [Desulfobaculum xiamenense]|uniref:Nucleotide-binding universal stress UspA family protein n=1 Tax=Desulfobaculum xiamenense TaxID=995050 RepID=A0A846QJL4_9BACT|nr:universal stress protein [Desulfobaculum xiamenense]NJB67287.1 nucleotide-binding universal stress UspA family protein [Desulfobaculum xiamenense]